MNDFISCMDLQNSFMRFEKVPIWSIFQEKNGRTSKDVENQTSSTSSENSGEEGDMDLVDKKENEQTSENENNQTASTSSENSGNSGDNGVETPNGQTKKEEKEKIILSYSALSCKGKGKEDGIPEINFRTLNAIAGGEGKEYKDDMKKLEEKLSNEFKKMEEGKKAIILTVPNSYTMRNCCEVQSFVEKLGIRVIQTIPRAAAQAYSFFVRNSQKRELEYCVIDMGDDELYKVDVKIGDDKIQLKKCNKVGDGDKGLSYAVIVTEIANKLKQYYYPKAMVKKLEELGRDDGEDLYFYNKAEEMFYNGIEKDENIQLSPPQRVENDDNTSDDGGMVLASEAEENTENTKNTKNEVNEGKPTKTFNSDEIKDILTNVINKIVGCLKDGNKSSNERPCLLCGHLANSHFGEELKKKLKEELKEKLKGQSPISFKDVEEGDEDGLIGGSYIHSGNMAVVSSTSYECWEDQTRALIFRGSKSILFSKGNTERSVEGGDRLWERVEILDFEKIQELRENEHVIKFGIVGTVSGREESQWIEAPIVGGAYEALRSIYDRKRKESSKWKMIPIMETLVVDFNTIYFHLFYEDQLVTALQGCTFLPNDDDDDDDDDNSEEYAD